MNYSIMLLSYITFTILDALITVIGTSIGCVELNPIGTSWGINFWIIFRILLMISMSAIFFFAHKIFSDYCPKGSIVLEKTLLFLNLYIGAVVFLGLFSISITLVFK